MERTEKKQRRARRQFTDEFKAEAVRLCRVGDRTIKKIAKDLDLTETALRDWVRRAEPEGEPQVALKETEREELMRLRRENKRLQTERADLAARDGVNGSCQRFAIPDVSVPSEPLMRATLDHIDAELAANRGVYVHCFGGIGRTGTVIGCWLLRHGLAS